MIDPKTPLEKIFEICNNLEELHMMLEEVEVSDDYYDSIVVDDSLLCDAIKFSQRNTDFDTADLQRTFSIPFSQAQKLCYLLGKSNKDSKS